MVFKRAHETFVEWIRGVPEEVSIACCCRELAPGLHVFQQSGKPENSGIVDASHITHIHMREALLVIIHSLKINQREEISDVFTVTFPIFTPIFYEHAATDDG